MNTVFSPHKIKELLTLVDQASKICLLTHLNPDGDAIGSTTAFQQYLVALGKEVDIIVPSKFPMFLHWMKGSDQIICYSDQPALGESKLLACDLIFCLDFNGLSRLDALGAFVSTLSHPRILIDHHLDPPNEYTIAFSEIRSSSTCELVYRLMEACGHIDLLNCDIAESLYTGILTDTGGFSHNSNNPELYRIVANLMEQGIDKAKIQDLLFSNFSASRMQLLGYTLSQKMVVLPQYHAAYFYLSKAELDAFNFQTGDTEGFVNLLLSIQGVNLAAFFVESNTGLIKISLRSTGDFSVNQFSRDHFNGGGHKNAAGGKSELSLEETCKKFEQILINYEL